MNNLKQIRSIMGLNQTELAKLLGVSKTSIVNAENGHLSTKLALKAAKVLNKNVFTILGDDVFVIQPQTKEDIRAIFHSLERTTDK